MRGAPQVQGAPQAQPRGAPQGQGGQQHQPQGHGNKDEKQTR
jgi:hypothetical protein